MGKGNDPNCQAGAVALLTESGCPDSWGLPAAIAHPEQTLPGVTDAAQMLAGALVDGQRIAVFCDYDPDGSFSGELLRRAFAAHQPTGFGLEGPEPVRMSYARQERGYGLDPQWVRDAADAGVQTIITVDCGSGSSDAVALAQQLGMRVVVCDHHEPDAQNPADFHLNPRLHRPGQESGSVCALKLAWALDCALSGTDIPSEALRGTSAWLAAFGARADMMDMKDPENAALLAHGREHVALHGFPPGLSFMCEEMGRRDPERDYKSLSACLNLPKRTPAASAQDVGRVLAAEDWAQAYQPVQRLLSIYETSKAALAGFIEEGLAQSQQQIAAAPEDRVVSALLRGEQVVSFSGHAGMVSNRLAGEHDRPAVTGCVLADGSVKWAARLGFRSSHKDRNMLECLDALQQCSILSGPEGSIVSVGGHPGAVSGRCDAERFETVLATFRDWAADQENWSVGEPIAS